MKKTMRKKQLLTLLAIIFALSTATAASAATLSENDKKFLAAYDKAHSALVADDLAGTKASAADLGDPGAELAKSNSLKEARDAFEKLSAKAKQLATGQAGYRVFHCPMLNKDWVQTSTTTENPYGGKEMVSCGQVQK